MPINPFKVKEKPLSPPIESGQDGHNKRKEKENLNQIIHLTEPEYVFDNLILPSSTSHKLLDFLAYKDCEEKVFVDWGLSATHRINKQLAVNFYGESGTGKTMAAHAVASHLKKPLLIVNYADVESKYVGETSKNICNIFRLAKEKNAIIFFDEADAILSRRVNNMSHATDVSVNQTRSVLLMLMNDYSGVIIFATNFIENYDAAFMRRISFHINFNLPDAECRIKIWNKYIPKKLPIEVNISVLADSSEGLSASDIADCVLRAAMAVARIKRTVVTEADFLASISDVKTSKQANKGQIRDSITTKTVSEEYVREQIS